MDRYPGYESMLARVEQKKVQVKGQLPTFYSHLVDNMVAFVLDQVNECCNVAMTDATTDTTEDYPLADGPVARALDTRSDVNEQTNLVNPQVDHHIQGTSGSSSNEPAVSPPSVTQSTIPANIEVKVEDESNGQSVQLCKRVKKEEDDGGEYVLDCDCGECEICRVKREMKEELDESGETEQNREDPSAGDEQQVLAENFVKRIEPADELGNKFECDYRGCGKQMKDRSNLISHIRIHTGEKPFKCSVEGCDRAFVQNNQLKQHLNTHSGTRPFVCSWPRCEARFGNKRNLTAHLRTHTGERPYQCDQCDATFTQHSHLVTHLRTHTGARPFVCTWPECGQAFTQSCHLKTHSIVHSNERQFVCDVRGCAKVYKHKVTLRQHQKAKHN